MKTFIGLLGVMALTAFGAVSMAAPSAYASTRSAMSAQAPPSSSVTAMPDTRIAQVILQNQATPI